MSRGVVATTVFCSLVAVLLLPSIGVARSGRQAPSHPAFRGRVDWVVLPVSVTGRGGRHVSDLRAEDFTVLDNGRPQVLTHFSNVRTPLALSLLLDTSDSMSVVLDVIQDAAVGFTRGLAPDDTAQVVTFNERLTVIQPFTRSGEAIEAAIRRVRTDGDTSLFTAVYVTLMELQARPPAELGEVRRHAIVLLSDGYDTKSLVPYERVLELARRSNVAIYAVAMGLRADNDVDGRILEGRYVLRQLAHVTGGRVLFPAEPADLINAFDEIADELSHQYTLAYMPVGPFALDDSWRTVLVRVDRPGLRATTRPGYIAR